MTDQQVSDAWKAEIVDAEIDPSKEYIWEGVWVGFVIGRGRHDLANYDAYMRLGFSREME